MTRVVFLVILIFFNIHSHAGSLSAEGLVNRIYAYKIKQFENGIFGGKFSPVKKCKLYEDLFASTLIRRDEGNCYLVVDGYGRYPRVDAGNIEQTGDQLPKFRFEEAKIDPGGEVAIPVILDDGTRILYFVQKIDGTQKVKNILVSMKWPRDPNAESNEFRCPFKFSIKPDAFEVGLLPDECRKVASYEID